MKPISVNIDDWLKTNGGNRKLLQQNTTAAEVEEMVHERAQQWMDEQDKRRREPLLADEKQECADCGEFRRPYKDDYICYECRDRLDA